MIPMLLLYNARLAICLLQENDTNFDDLGKLLLAGVAAALVFAIAFAFVRLRLRDKKPPASSFISISSARERK